MKKVSLILLATAFLVLTGMGKKAQDTAQAADKSGEPAKSASFTLKDLNGNEVSLKEFEGKKAVMVIFGATWCPYCVKEIPEIIKLQNKFKDKDIQILMIDLQESPEAVSAFGKKRGVNYTVLIDPTGDTAKAYEVEGIPTNIVIDKKGKQVYKGYTFPPDTEKFLENLAK